MLIIVLGLISGLLLGITGGGGAIVSVPALVYGLHMPMQIATTLSLFVVGGSALLGTILKRKQVAWGKGLIFAILGSLFSPVGSFLAKRFSESSLIAGFAILMLIVAVLMFKRSNAKSPPLNNSATNNQWLVVIVAILTGLLTGFFGVGGGFMIVPALVLLNKLENKTAAATSLFIISLISISSLANKVAEIELDVKLVLIFMLGSLLGMLAGNYISQKISNKLSQRIFAATSALLGVYMLIDSVLKFAV